MVRFLTLNPVPAAEAATLVCVALLVSLPFLVPVHRFPITTFDSDWAAAIFLGVALIPAATAICSSVVVSGALPTIAIGLPALGALQLVLGALHYSYALSLLCIAMATMLGGYVLGRAIVAMTLRERALHAICAGLVAGGLLSVVVQLLQTLDIHVLPAWIAMPMTGTPSTWRPFGNLAQPNHLATYLVWATIACLHLSAGAHPRRWRYGALALLFCGLALTGSRTGAIFGIAVVILVLVPNPLARAAFRDRIGVSIALCVGYATGLLFTALFLVDQHGAMANSFERFAEGSLSQRLSMWSDAWRIALAHPLLGVGIGEYGGAQYLAAQLDPALLATNNPHNILLHIAAEFGFPAALLVAAAVLAWVRQCRASFHESPRAITTIIVLVAFLLAHSLVEYPLWNLFFLIPTALLAGLAEPAKPTTSFALPARFALAPIGVALLVGGAVLRADYDEVASIWAVYLQEIYDGRPHDAETARLVASKMSSTFFKPQMERLHVEVLPSQSQKSEADLALVARVLSRLADVRVITRYIELLLQAGRLDEAIPHIQRLKLFAGGQYPSLRDEILGTIADGGPLLDPIRQALMAP